MDINSLAARQYDWVERMHWHNKTVLESLALIGSEIGEAAEEVLTGNKEALAEELADVFLRIADLAVVEKFDLAELVNNAKLKWRSNNIEGKFLEIMVEFAKWTNTARKEKLDESFGIAMGQITKSLFDIAEKEGFNMEFQILRKMEINEERGTRGRRI